MVVTNKSTTKWAPNVWRSESLRDIRNFISDDPFVRYQMGYIKLTIANFKYRDKIFDSLLKWLTYLHLFPRVLNNSVL
ncbi:hypothetical protein RJ641_015563 [Dillenia turbinata]|uniref:Uncharacterized protein n=1 Tax=Dillenia turbinata TaxID=194707 RepID=A0AAN8US91_9MAGN